MKQLSCDRLSPRERYAVCGTGALALATLSRYERWLATPEAERGAPPRRVVLYRLRSALQQLNLTDRFPELFSTALGSAADPDPRKVIEPEDVEAPAAE